MSCGMYFDKYTAWEWLRLHLSEEDAQDLIRAVQQDAKNEHLQGYAAGRDERCLLTTVECRAIQENQYERGLDDAWECARKICYQYSIDKLLGMGFKIEFDNITDKDEYELSAIILNEYSASEAIAKMQKYEKKKQSEEIKVGDEVRIKGSDPLINDCDFGVCLRSAPNVKTMYVMRKDGSCGEECKEEWYKTGKHYSQIAEVLKQMVGGIDGTA